MTSPGDTSMAGQIFSASKEVAVMWLMTSLMFSGSGEALALISGRNFFLKRRIF